MAGLAASEAVDWALPTEVEVEVDSKGGAEAAEAEHPEGSEGRVA